MSLAVSRGDRCVRLELSTRAPGARAALALLAGIWVAFAAVWLVLVLALGGPLLLALAGLLFLPFGLLAAARLLAAAPGRWTVEMDACRGLVAAWRGFLSRGSFTVPLADIERIEAAPRPGPGGLPRAAVRVTAGPVERWFGEGHAREELERAAAVLQEGVRTARAPSAATGPARST